MFALCILNHFGINNQAKNLPQKIFKVNYFSRFKVQLFILNCKSHPQFNDYSYQGSVNPGEQSLGGLLNDGYESSQHQSQISRAGHMIMIVSGN